MHVVFLASSVSILNPSYDLSDSETLFCSTKASPSCHELQSVNCDLLAVEFVSDEYGFSVICFPHRYVWIFKVSVLPQEELYLSGYYISRDTLGNIYIIGSLYVRGIFETKIKLQAFEKQIHNLVRSGILFVFAVRLLRLIHKGLRNMLGEIIPV